MLCVVYNINNSKIIRKKLINYIVDYFLHIRWSISYGLWLTPYIAAFIYCSILYESLINTSAFKCNPYKLVIFKYLLFHKLLLKIKIYKLFYFLKIFLLWYFDLRVPGHSIYVSIYSKMFRWRVIIHVADVYVKQNLLPLVYSELS